MNDKRSFQRDSYLVVCEPFVTTSGKFAARYVIYKGDTEQGPVKKRQEFPSVEFDSPETANTHAADAAMDWIDRYGSAA